MPTGSDPMTVLVCQETPLMYDVTITYNNPCHLQKVRVKVWHQTIAGIQCTQD